MPTASIGGAPSKDNLVPLVQPLAGVNSLQFLICSDGFEEIEILTDIEGSDISSVDLAQSIRTKLANVQLKDDLSVIIGHVRSD